MTLTLEIDAETAAALRAFRAEAPTEGDRREAALARIRSGFYAARLSGSDAFADGKVEERAQEQRYEVKRIATGFFNDGD